MLDGLDDLHGHINFDCRKEVPGQRIIGIRTTEGCRKQGVANRKGMPSPLLQLYAAIELAVTPVACWLLRLRDPE
ncbi:hypothetical protein PMI35_03728 [Pseudomonas sp. GM78]|uniref:hypothetical protein n=1 Tax=Pseudomonas sp. GM78 TaxID=1144337 RepID=UPI000270B994|nr:hypothetical protein [Pseudomonas sp. GM78]EJN26886.1 hypothetical protein PMI35_03728 [Pseudomonas sp. GM78]